MVTLGEGSDGFEPKSMRNITDLEIVKLDVELVMNEERKDSEGKQYIVNYAIVDGQEYRIPSSVLEQIKEIRKQKPDTKAVKVTKSGSGLGTKYNTFAL